MLDPYEMPVVDDEQRVIDGQPPVLLRVSQEDSALVVDCQTAADGVEERERSGELNFTGPRVWVERLDRGWRIFIHPAEPGHDRHVVAVEMLDDGAITIDPDGAPIARGQ